MTKAREFPRRRLLAVATMVVGAYLAGDAAAQSRSAPVAPPPRPTSQVPVPAPKPRPKAQVPADPNAAHFNHVIKMGSPRRTQLPPAGNVVVPTAFTISLTDTNNSSMNAPATRVLVALNDKKIGVFDLPAFPSPPAVERPGAWGWPSTWEWIGPPRVWSMVTGEVPCLRLEARPRKYGDRTTDPRVPDNDRQYHSGCIVNLKAWMDVPESVPCPTGTVCVEPLPLGKPTVAVDLEVLDAVSAFPPCPSASATDGPNCLRPGFGWKG